MIRRAGRSLVWRLAPRVGFAVYEPSFEHREHLDALTTYREDPRPIRDKRPTTATGDVPDLTITVDGLADALAGRDRTRLRVLEIGPKYGIHSLWVDRELEPSELVFCDLPYDRVRHREWQAELARPHRFVYADLASADELLELPPFDLVLFLGVLYHTINHLPMLATLNRATRMGGEMLLETTVDPRPDSALRLRWQGGNAKAKAVPTLDAARVMLAWTGWRTVTRFTDYRPGSTEELLLCEKTDELPEGSLLSDVVTPHRPAPEE